MNIGNVQLTQQEVEAVAPWLFNGVTYDQLSDLGRSAVRRIAFQGFPECVIPQPSGPPDPDPVTPAIRDLIHA
jgi:hypothetical protein